MSERDFFTEWPQRVANNHDLWLAFMILWLRVYMSCSSWSHKAMEGFECNRWMFLRYKLGRASPILLILSGGHHSKSSSIDSSPGVRLPWASPTGLCPSPSRWPCQLLSLSWPEWPHSQWFMKTSIPAVGIMHIQCAAWCSSTEYKQMSYE